MHRFLATNQGIFGKVTSPTGGFGDNPSSDLGRFIGIGLYLVFVVGGIVALIYMLWGGINYITSGGDKERLAKARSKIVNAVVGIFILIFVFALFVTIFQFILGGTIIKYENGGLRFKLPTLGAEGDGSISCPAGCVASAGTCACPGGGLPP